jgi:hypothetical protein
MLDWVIIIAGSGLLAALLTAIVAIECHALIRRRR